MTTAQMPARTAKRRIPDGLWIEPSRRWVAGSRARRPPTSCWRRFAALSPANERADGADARCQRPEGGDHRTSTRVWRAHFVAVVGGRHDWLPDGQRSRQPQGRRRPPGTARRYPREAPGSGAINWRSKAMLRPSDDQRGLPSNPSQVRVPVLVLQTSPAGGLVERWLYPARDAAFNDRRAGAVRVIAYI